MPFRLGVAKRLVSSVGAGQMGLVQSLAVGEAAELEIACESSAVRAAIEHHRAFHRLIDPQSEDVGRDST